MITVVVPAYNCESVICRCIKSLLLQTYTDFEILVVNDGSTDSTASQVRAIDDSRICLINQQNAGVSAARNRGIENAKGDWIVFVDSDDYVERTYLQTLISLSDDGCMPVVGFAKNESCESVLHDGIRGKYAIDTLMSQDYLIGFLGDTIGFSCWNKLFSKQTLMNYHIRFEPSLKLGEDLLFVFQYLCYCEYVAFSEKAVYHYCDVDNSTIHAAKDQSILYESTLIALKNSCYNGYSFNDEVLCGWCLKVMTYVLSNPYVCTMSFRSFCRYYKRVKSYHIVKMAAQAVSRVGFRLTVLRWALCKKTSLPLFLIIKMQYYKQKGN